MKFVGDRLRVARTINGYTQRDLAEKVAASAAYLSRIEKDEREPAEVLVCAIAQELHFSETFFYRPLLDEFTQKECSFRKRVTTPEKIKDRILAHGTLLGELVREIRKDIRFPALNIPRNPTAWGKNAVEETAQMCRAHWGFGEGPIVNMVRVLERAGIIVVRMHDHSEKIDAFSRAGGIPFVILNDAKGSSSRTRSDMAHELGHLVMHDGATDADQEDDAQFFGSAFLLPEGAFGRHYKSYGPSPSWTAFFEMKRYWKVSLGMLVERAFRLGLMGAAEYRQRQKHMRYKGWHKGEPFEPEAEQPEILKTAIATVLQGTERSFDDLLRALGWTSERFTELTGIVAPAAPGDPDVIPLARARLAVS